MVKYTENNDEEEMDLGEVKKYPNDYLDGALIVVPTYSAIKIKELPFSLKEEMHKSRQRSGRFIFWGWMRSMYNELDGPEKLDFVNVFFSRHPTVERHLQRHSIGQVIIDDCHESYYRVSHHDVQIIINYLWKYVLNSDVVDAWVSRASKLNLRPIKGVSKFPIRNNINFDSKKMLVSCLKDNWKRFLYSFKYSINHATTFKISKKNYVFGSEKVTVGSSGFLNTQIPKILRFVLFGDSSMLKKKM